MVTTSNLLTAFMLGGWLAVTPPALAASGQYNIHGGIVTGNAQVGDVRMAGNIPVARMGQNFARGHRWGTQTRNQVRYSGGASYAKLNQ